MSKLIIVIIEITRQCRWLRRVAVPFIDGEILVDGDGDDCRVLDCRMRVAGNVSHRRVGEEFHDHRHIVSHVRSEHHRRLKGKDMKR